ncbi:vitellogenin-like [Scylla paramamosain]|uniref:vitellogenin-like n=1 Tax=Scylla paramamosain TaxID=85552 RepID=UPI003082FD60
MELRVVVLLISLGSVTGTTPYCSTECPVASAKFSYVPSKTYSYAYSGVSRVRLKGVDGGLVQTRWENQVHLTWLTHCEVAITFNATKVDGQAGPPDTNPLEKYPLVVAVTDGRVQRVCSHADDDTWSINIKKGVASALQNSLPSLSTTNSGLIFTETDVAGTCPTKYEVQNEGAEIKVVKNKDHRQCQERYSIPDEIHLPWLKGPLPIQESWSTCTQIVINGTISSVVCEDVNVVRPAYGVYKFIDATQVSELRLISEASPAPDSVSFISQPQLVPRSLVYDYETPKKDPSVVPELEQTLRHVCQLTKDGVDGESASWLDKVVRLMRRVPEHSISQMYHKVRNGQLCAEHDKLKGLFLDAVSFVHESGSVPVMVNELVEGQVSEGRAVLYSVAFYFTSRPTASNIETLKPLFELPQLIPLVTLSAASMINTFCRHNEQCSEQPSIRDISDALNTKLQSQCSPFSEEEAQDAALLTLKALGNIGLVNHEVSTSIVRCMRTQGPPVVIRVAAAETLRLMSCEESITEDLVDIILDPDMDTEVRIAAYRAVFHCARHDHLNRIVTTIADEQNTQARGFILSHLWSTQRTNTPHKERLRSLLTNVVLPVNFEADISKYSHSFDFSYFSPSLGIGSEIESNLIYAPGSFVPRSLGVNITAALEGISMNVAELGMRLEGLDPILAQLFGLADYFETVDYIKIIKDVFKLLQNNGNMSGIRQRRFTEHSVLTNVLNEIYHNNIFNIKGDIGIRIMGQDIFFSSTSVDLSNLNFSEIKAKIYALIYSLVHQFKTLRKDTVRMLRPDLDYSFPTIQGTPLKLTTHLALVGGLQVETHLDEFASYSGFKIIPSLSVDAGCFIGYDAHIAKTGFKMNTAISTSNGVTLRESGHHGKQTQLHLDLHKKMVIFSGQAEAYLMKSKMGQPDTKIVPPSMHDMRIRRKSCVTSLESVLGLKLCYDVDVPDIFHNNALPLGAPAFARLSLNRTESSMKGYLINATMEKHRNKETLTMFCKTYGSNTTRGFDIEASVLHGLTNNTFSVVFNASQIYSRVAMVIIHSENEKSLHLFGMTRYDNSTWKRAVKFSSLTTKTQYTREYDFGIFYGHNQSSIHQAQILEINIMKKKNGPQVTLEIQGGTRHALAQYLSLDIGIGVDVDQRPHSWLLLPVRLRKLEFEGGLGGWKVIAFTNTSTESGRKTQYLSAFKVTHRNRQLVHVETGLSLIGTPSIDFVAQLVTKGGLEEVQYKGEASVYMTSNRVGASLRLHSAVNSTTLARLEAFCTENQNKFSIRTLVEVPRVISTTKAVVSVVIPHSGDLFQVEAAVTHNSTVLLHVQGPMNLDPGNDIFQVNVQWNISMIGGDPYKVNSMVIMGNNSQFMYVIVSNSQGQPLLSLESSPSSDSLEETKYETAFFLSRYVQAETHLAFSTRQLQVALNTLIFPNAQDSRRVKIFSQVDLTTGTVIADVWWDADRDANKKLKMDLTFASLPQLSDYSSLQGSIKYQNETCRFLAVGETVQLRHSVMRKTSLSFGIQTGERKYMNMEFENSIETRNGSVYIETKMKYFGLENKKYKFLCSLDLEDPNGLQNFRTESHIVYSSPMGIDTSYSTLITHQSSAGERFAQIKVNTSLSTLKQPLEMDLTWMRQNHSRSLVWRANHTSLLTLMDWRLNTVVSEIIQSCSFILNLRAVEQFLNDAVKFIVIKNNNCFNSVCPESHWNNENSSHILHPNASQSPWAQPPFLMAASSPEAEVGMHEYSVTGRYTYNSWTDTFHCEGKVSHPALDREVTAAVEYRITGTAQKGSFELDIFPDTTDKITGSLVSILLANNTVMLEANLTTRLLSYHPKITLSTSASPHTLAFDMEFSKNPNQKANFKAKTKFDRISEEAAAVGFMIATEGGVSVDVSGVVGMRQVPECYGLQITTSSFVPLLGNHSCVLTACGPAFVQLTIGRKDERGKIYHIKFGIRNPLGFEGNIVVRDQERQEVFDVLRSYFTLYPHVDMEFVYMNDELRKFEAEVRAVLMMVKQGGKDWVARVYQAVVNEARRRHYIFPPRKILTLIHHIENNLKKISTYLVHEKLEPAFEITRRLLNTPTARYLRKVSYTVWLFVRWAKTQLPHDPYYPYQERVEWKKEMQSYNFLVRKVGKQVVKIIQTGGEDLLLTIQHLLTQLEHTVIFQELKEDLAAFISSHSYPYQREALQEVLARVAATLIRDLAPLKNNPTLLWVTFLTLRNINTAVGKITLTPLTSLRDMMWAYNSYSTIPSNNLLWLYDSLPLPSQWTNLLPPWNRIAMVIGDTEIHTFDGAELRIPLSRCEVILASFAGNKVTLSHPVQGARAQVTVTTPRVTVVVRPDFHVFLNGRDIGHRDVTEGEVTILVSYLQITINSPLVTVKVLEQQRLVSVEALGWTFGHLAGMLGTYDGEAGNDRLMSTGTRAPDLWRLVKSWQEDQHCPTPPVSPITPSIREAERVAHCHPLLGMWARCNALVRPEPFIHMCYITRSPCDAAEAYRSLCASKGVEPLIPRGC